MPEQSPEQLAATDLSRSMLVTLGVTDPVSAPCPEDGTVCLADPEAPYFVCGYCGFGPFTSKGK
jgi:hypothetical protein